MTDLRATAASAHSVRSPVLDRSNQVSGDTAKLEALRKPSVEASDVRAAEQLQERGLSELTRSMLNGEVPAGAALDKLRSDVRALERVAPPPADAAGRRAWAEATRPVLERAQDASARLGNAVFFSGANHLQADAAAADRTVRAFEKRFGSLQEPTTNGGEVPWFMRPLENLTRGARAVNKLLGGEP